MPTFSQTAKSLNVEAIGKGMLDWTEEMAASFETFSQEAIKLTLPDPNKPFEIWSDVSRSALAAALVRGNRVIHITQRPLTPTEAHLPISLLELRAIIFAVKKWRNRLFGAPATVFVDHKDLQWVLDMKDPPGPLGVYAAELPASVAGKNTTPLRRCVASLNSLRHAKERSNLPTAGVL
jgi:hypothetical protein